MGAAIPAAGHMQMLFVFLASEFLGAVCLMKGNSL
jgi:hypothetical protein